MKFNFEIKAEESQKSNFITAVGQWEIHLFHIDFNKVITDIDKKEIAKLTGREEWVCFPRSAITPENAHLFMTDTKYFSPEEIYELTNLGVNFE